jgi:hypothetical protein
MKFIHLIPFIFLLSDACIERYDLPATVSEPKLVVDGLITDQPGPATIRLYQSLNVNTNINQALPVTGAVITIYDDAGAQEMLTEISKGVYQTSGDDLQGHIGRKYHVTIRIQEREYVSEPQELQPAGIIRNIYHTIRQNSINHNDLTQPQHAMDIYLDADGEPGFPNLFRWRWSSIYEVKTFPELRTQWLGRPPVEIPDPVPCSGYVAGNGPGGIRQNGPCTCCNCWVDEAGDRALISNNRFTENNSFRGVFVARLPIDQWRFNIKYMIRVEQLSVSEEVYAFWQLIKSQQDGEGSLFQPNAVTVKGNIRSTTDPEEKVLGVFAVSAVTTKELFIERKNISVIIYTDTVKASCQDYFRGSSNVKPIFW